jgi:hypothetical protein
VDGTGKNPGIAAFTVPVRCCSAHLTKRLGRHPRASASQVGSNVPVEAGAEAGDGSERDTAGLCVRRSDGKVLNFAVYITYIEKIVVYTDMFTLHLAVSPRWPDV